MPTMTENGNPLLRFLWSLFRPRRFFAVSLAMGGVVWLATAGSHPMFRILAASDTFFFAFVLYAVLLAFRMQPDQLRRRQHGEHVARLAMVFVSFCAVILSLVAIFTLLNHPRSEGNLFPIFAVSSVPLTWAMLHIMAASHYTHLYYSESRTGVPEGGLIFPGGTVPFGHRLSLLRRGDRNQRLGVRRGGGIARPQDRHHGAFAAVVRVQHRPDRYRG